MIVPNKVIRFSESIIGKMTFILNELNGGELSVGQLYTSTQEYFEEIDEFIFSLDVLYILDSIQVDFEKGVVKYVKRD
ncbi:ABC-three component system middle component 7 [Peribacillus sp. NPDC006672]|uniref:ABC-three component system middle component 7 n=1 Tax=Peribacillus sp. NPDC006672 TaxID=3390606 RepID=UPI003D0697DF